jgi:hypothetical protein
MSVSEMIIASEHSRDISVDAMGRWGAVCAIRRLIDP